MGLFGREVLGLHLTANEIRLAQVKLQRQPEVNAFATVSVSAASSKEEGSGLVIDAVAEGLKALLKDRSNGVFRSRDCYISLPESKVFRKILELPASLSEDELWSAINNEAASYLPGDVSAMEMDYQIIPSEYFEKPDPALRHIALVAVGKSIVQDYLAVCAAAKLRPMAVDTRPAAMARSLISPQDKDLALIVVCDKDNAVVSLVQQGIVWATGLAQCTDDIADTVASIADEVEHVHKFYANRSGKTKGAKKLILSTSGEYVALKKPLQAALDVTVQEAKYILSVPPGFDRSYAAAAGAALYPLYSLL